MKSSGSMKQTGRCLVEILSVCRKIWEKQFDRRYSMALASNISGAYIHDLFHLIVFSIMGICGPLDFFFFFFEET